MDEKQKRHFTWKYYKKKREEEVYQQSLFQKNDRVMVEFKDNFLSKKEHKRLCKLMNGRGFPWYYAENITFDKKKDGTNLFYMTHHFYEKDRPLSDLFDDYIMQFYDKLKVKAFIRVKGNLYPSQRKRTEHLKHWDYYYSHKAAIYCINTCDGYTLFDNGLKVDSVANRIITFDGSEDHASTDCTNTKSSININFNYF